MLQIMKNETEDFMALAKAYAQAERALRIERWVIVTFELRKTDGPIEILYRYDLPRTMLKRYRWVVRWRTARFQCRFPRDTITATYCYYDKRTGLKFGVDSCLSKLRAAKAQITLAKRREREHIEQQRLRYPLFYDEQADPELLRFRQKLQEKLHRYLNALLRLRWAVLQHRQKTITEMMPLPITEIDDFCEASFGGYSALFTEERIDRASLPEGIYAYDIRSGEGNDFGTIEPCVTVNHTGTILTRQPIEMGPEGYIEIDMDGDDGLIDAMTYDEWIAQPETTC